MKRRWILAGLVLTAPCLVLTALLIIFALIAIVVVIFSSEWVVENRTVEPVWVTPMGMGSRSPVLIPHYSTRLPTHANGDVLVHPGSKTKLIVDGWAEMDSSPLGLVVNTGNGEYRYDKWTPNGLYVLHDLSALSPAREDMLAVLRLSRSPRYFDIRFFLIIGLGVVAPFGFLYLRRAYRKLKPSP